MSDTASVPSLGQTFSLTISEHQLEYDSSFRAITVITFLDYPTSRPTHFLYGPVSRLTTILVVELGAYQVQLLHFL